MTTLELLLPLVLFLAPATGPAPVSHSETPKSELSDREYQKCLRWLEPKNRTDRDARLPGCATLHAEVARREPISYGGVLAEALSIDDFLFFPRSRPDHLPALRAPQIRSRIHQFARRCRRNLGRHKLETCFLAWVEAQRTQFEDFAGAAPWWKDVSAPPACPATYKEVETAAKNPNTQDERHIEWTLEKEHALPYRNLARLYHGDQVKHAARGVIVDPAYEQGTRGTLRLVDRRAPSIQCTYDVDGDYLEATQGFHIELGSVDLRSTGAGRWTGHKIADVAPYDVAWYLDCRDAATPDACGTRFREMYQSMRPASPMAPASPQARRGG